MSVVDRRELGVALRGLRTDRNLTAVQVVEQLAAIGAEISPSTITQWEQGKRAPKPQDLWPLLRVYGIDVAGPEGVQLLTLSKLARQRSWWSESAGALRGSFTTLLGLETEASAIAEYSATVLPGLVQTSEYAESVMLSNSPQPSPETVTKRLAVRLRRQELLLGDQSKLQSLHLVLDEGCIRRMVGGEQVWRDQLQHLLKLSAQPRITLQVVPFAVGSHAGTLGSFTIMTFPEAPMIAAVELAGTDISEEGAGAEPYRVRFDKLREQALPAPLSLSLITEVANGRS